MTPGDFIVLANWGWYLVVTVRIHRNFTGTSGRRHYDLLIHSVTLSWHWANQSLAYLNNIERLTRKRQVSILMSLVWLDQGSKPRGLDSVLIHHSPLYAMTCHYSPFIMTYHYEYISHDLLLVGKQICIYLCTSIYTSITQNILYAHSSHSPQGLLEHGLVIYCSSLPNLSSGCGAVTHKIICHNSNSPVLERLCSGANRAAVRACSRSV